MMRITDHFTKVESNGFAAAVFPGRSEVFTLLTGCRLLVSTAVGRDWRSMAMPGFRLKQREMTHSG